MRVRQWAVVGAAAIGLLAGGVGTAQAGEEEGLPNCDIAFSAAGVVDQEGVPAPCGDVEARTVAEVGCSGPGLLDVAVRGLELDEKYQLVTEQGTSSNAFLPRPDGTLDLVATFDADTEVIAYAVQTEDGETVYRDVEDVEDVCAGTATLTVSRDCAGAGAVTFVMSVTDLLPDEEYDVDYESDGFVLNPGYSGNAIFFDTFTTNSEGAAEVRTPAVDEAISVSSGAFTVDFAVYGAYSGVSSIEGHAQSTACATPPVGTAPGSTAPVVTAPVAAAPVTVVPVAAHPAVLANTGTPVTAAALLGGGMLVVGAGALVATRRRAS